MMTEVAYLDWCRINVRISAWVRLMTHEWLMSVLNCRVCYDVRMFFVRWGAGQGSGWRSFETKFPRLANNISDESNSLREFVWLQSFLPPARVLRTVVFKECMMTGHPEGYDFGRVLWSGRVLGSFINRKGCPHLPSAPWAYRAAIFVICEKPRGPIFWLSRPCEPILKIEIASAT